MITDMIVGRLHLPESDFRDFAEKPSDVGGGRGVTLAGAVVGGGPAGVREVRVAQQNLIGLYGDMVPVAFSEKTDWNGYYYVNNVTATMTEWTDEAAKCEWSIECDLAGFANDLDLESRLGGPLTLANSHSATGERWHAPSSGHNAYWAGSSSPSVLTRTGSEGPITVYRGIPVGVNPRWNCDPSLYGGGRCRFLTSDNHEIHGLASPVIDPAWTISNSLIKFKATGSAETFVLSSYLGGVWYDKRWDLRFNDTDLGAPTAVTITRNSYEMVGIRLMWKRTPSGRISADISLRRGSRMVDMYIKSSVSGKIGIHPSVGEATTNGAGFVTPSSSDGSGNKYTTGTPGSYTADLTNGGLSLSSTIFLDTYIGLVAGADGTDTAALMYQHFLGAPTERIIGVRL